MALADGSVSPSPGRLLLSDRLLKSRLLIAIGDKDGVKLEKKGAVNGTDLPLVRGTWYV